MFNKALRCHDALQSPLRRRAIGLACARAFRYGSPRHRRVGQAIDKARNGFTFKMNRPQAADAGVNIDLIYPATNTRVVLGVSDLEKARSVV